MTGRRLLSGPDFQVFRNFYWPEAGFASINGGMSAPDLDVRYVAHLARVALNDEEIEMFQAQLGQVLEYVEQLKRVDVSGVEPMAHTNPVFNVFREDQDREWFTPEEALANAPQEVNGLFSVTKVVE